MSRPEFYRFGPYAFDIAAIERGIADGSIDYTEGSLDVVQFAEQSLGLRRSDPSHQPMSVIGGIDYAHLASIDAARLAHPVLVAATAHGNILIDGHHRVAKAYLSGIDCLQARMIVHHGLPTMYPPTEDTT